MPSTHFDQQQQPSSNDQDWHLLKQDQVLRRFESNRETGLSSRESILRLKKFGKNELVEAEKRTGWKIFFAQLHSSLVVLLIAAMIISLVLGEVIDAAAILAIIVLNTLLGFWQDFQAEKSLAELKKLSVPEVMVRRDGDTVQMPAADLVPGDIVLLNTGFYIPADCRLLEVSDLSTDEAALTGESLPVEKTANELEQTSVSIGDRTNMAFMGTMTVRGHAVAVVTATGMGTELGKIAGSLQSVKPEPTPLQLRLAQLSRTLAVIAIVVVAIVFVAGLVAGQPARLMLLTALSLAVAIVPEGLPAVATVALAIGAKRMFQRNALIRQLPAVETLGSVSVICSDKTGTLTQNRMTATILDVANARVKVDQITALQPQIGTERTKSDSAHELPDGVSDREEESAQNTAIQLLLIGGCLCNDAQLQRPMERSGKNRSTTDPPPTPVAVGEPTEKALVEVAALLGVDQVDIQSMFPRIAEVAFDSKRKRMTTLHSISRDLDSLRLPDRLFKHQFVAFIKGSVESVLEISKWVWADGQVVELDSNLKQRIQDSHDQLASQGTRVLAIGFRTLDTQNDNVDLERDLIFVGMVGLADPPRAEAKIAVARCRRAGIRPIMITGDHPLTASTVAEQLGIAGHGNVLTGRDLAELSAESLRERVIHASVFARVAPEDKLHIVEALQHNDEVVAMTGDGVNDAPALKQAHIGVAMGKTGTDVSKEAANMVLLDDNFATIVAAVEQGRIVYDNIRKFVKYTMSSNVGEVLVMTLGVVLGMPLPLLPLQILWVNLVTDGLPGLALAVEPAEKNTMSRPPFPPDEQIFNRKMTREMLGIGMLIGIVSLAAGAILASAESNIDHWRTVVFTVLTFAQLGNVVACRSEGPAFWKGRTEHNMWLWGAIAITFLLQLVVVYVPPMQTVFHTHPLTIAELIACGTIGALVFGLIESQKLISIRRKNP